MVFLPLPSTPTPPDTGEPTAASNKQFVQPVFPREQLPALDAPGDRPRFPFGMPAPGMPVPMDGRDHGYVPRHTPFISQPDYRIYDLNKRLQQRTEESDNLWWDVFATDFFEDDATLTLCFCLEDGPKRYTIGRTLIPRYFRTVFEGGVTDLYYLLKHPKESFHNTTITLDCEQTTMVTHHGKPMFTKVCTEGRLVVEFTFDDLMRIRSWYFDIRQHRELIPRSVINIQDPTMLEQLSKNITRQGLTNCTLNYLRLCVILEPMQELMSRHKVYNLSPRDCLKATLFQKWQHTNRPQPKRRKRKSSQTMNPVGGNNMAMNNIGGSNSKKKSPGSFSSDGMPTDVMVVGEPSLMGGEFGDEDERLITRLENAQADANNGMDNDEDFAGGDSGATGPGPGPGGPKSANSSSGPGQGSWNATDTKPPPGTNPQQDEKPVTASQN